MLEETTYPPRSVRQLADLRHAGFGILDHNGQVGVLDDQAFLCSLAARCRIHSF
jgi:hypothetical protein